MEMEKTLVLIKPDGVKRGLIGRILSRFEETGLKIIAMKMILPDVDLAKNHYQLDEQWALAVYKKTKDSYEKEDKKLHYKDHMDLGKTIQKWNMEFLREGPVIAIVLEGYHAIEVVRKMVGSTEPRQATPGTIRGDFATLESYAVADSGKRVLRNLIHASDSTTNGKREIELWFTAQEIQSYKTVHELALSKE